MTNQLSNNQFYSVPQIASRWDVHPKLVYQEISARRLNALKIGNKVLRIPRESLESYEANFLARAA